jgi:tetratricopeptide (TPR) repeat protein
MLVGILLPLPAHAQKRSAVVEQDPLMRARVLYNQGEFDGAIAAAIKARALPGAPDAADLLLARAHLERFRRTSDRADLVAARESLNQIRPERLVPRDRTDLVVGLGEALFLEGHYGASAELFEGALARADTPAPAMAPPGAPTPGQPSSPVLHASARERVLDWWATALDREAQTRLSIDRDVLYARILELVQRELAREPGSAAAAYWLSAASRALGDLDRAWDTAVAGWVRSTLAGEAGAALRADLDRLVLQAIIPERVRMQAEGDLDRERIAGEMRATWEAIKKDWKRGRPPDEAGRLTLVGSNPYRRPVFTVFCAAGFGDGNSGA